ncbi:MarR family winged helix-turn-helix transcriptional regulator [Hippea alviniae]|uniref:MarR family winged helix-turn-helix transcriptional regulator n=1 Tax=Hippea alviniae TaxID=1279027 RepID=UPI0004069D73|nr:MarR family winged helix-turn-helix transcriptional regulator [Hippea alviniae]
MSVFSLAGELILGSRFKRLSDRFLTDVSLIYKNQQIEFEPSWFAIFYLLDRYGELTMSEIAHHLDLTQSAVSQSIASLQEKGLVIIKPDEKDKRFKVVCFTQKAKEILKSAKPIWKLIRTKMREMLDEGENSKFMLEALDELESAFRRKPLSKRVLESIKNSSFAFVRYADVYYLSLKKLVFEWMFNFGCADEEIVDDFKGFIKKTDSILAVKEREVVAAVIYIKDKNSVLVCDKDDVDNKVAASLTSKFFSEVKPSNCRVLLDADKPMIMEMLLNEGFKLSKITEREDVNRRVAEFVKNG